MPSETAIKKAIIDEVRKRPGVWIRKNHGSRYQTSGIPDLEVIFRPELRPGTAIAESISASVHAIVVFVELKKPGEKTSPIQDEMILRLQNAGAFAAVLYSKNEVIGYLESLGMPLRPGQPRKESRR